MVFSSFVFLFIFLPVVLIAYYLVKNIKIRNVILCISSLFFYSWGEPIYVLLMIFSIIVNYFLAILIDKNKTIKKQKFYLFCSIFVNLAILGFFKYSNFLIDNINSLFNTNIGLLDLSLPIGISFYTFQIFSYVIDVYWKKTKVQKNLINLATYISLFPQLVAGPIVRYQTIEDELNNRKESLDLFVDGLRRFIIGLAKKVIIANNVAIIADTIYGDVTGLGTSALWIAAIAYTLQIYFDFSGYSDMAIGLGKMFGFHFLENFNYPYIAKSVNDFWRRWHISLSTWFRDYVYIPLGGNRVSKIKWIRNLLVVWFLTGLWHGASWNYIIWGLYYFVFLLIEKLFLNKYLEKTPSIIRHIYALIIIIIGWVIFRIENLNDLGYILKNMFIITDLSFIKCIISNYEIMAKIPYVIIGIIGMVPITQLLKKKYGKTNLGYTLSLLVALVLFGLSIALLLSTSYNPFIYFRF